MTAIFGSGSSADAGDFDRTSGAESYDGAVLRQKVEEPGSDRSEARNTHSQ